jgi:lipocalin
MGVWFEVARYDHSFERGLEQCKALYTLLPDGRIVVENSGVDSHNGKFRLSVGKAKAGDKAGQLRVSFFWFFYSDYNILALGDEYDWALVGSKSAKYLWILSRTPKLDDATRALILANAESRGYDTTRLLWVKQWEK